MCGISGVYHFGGEDETAEKIVHTMAQQLIHRGPDDEGTYISKNKKLGFGFRRLAIIDLSPTGHQPMCNEDETVWAIFNGEIYNFASLREELLKAGHTFRSKSDTETIIHAYEEYGTACVEKLNGMFAIALWDEKRGRLWLARDRLGIKPIYYSIVGKTLIFGSEIKAILAHPLSKKKLNREALFHYLTFACCPAPMTLFEGINKLPAGWEMIVDESGVHERQYWDATPKVGSSHGAAPSEESFVKDIRDILTDSVQAQMVSDVPFGVFLSGGVDSSTNAALMTQARGKSVDSFSINIHNLPRYDEFQWARRVAKDIGANHHEISVGPREMMEFLPTLAYHADDPNGDPVCFPLYYISKLIRSSGVIVAQVGEGSDELFAGYDHYGLVLNFWKRWWRRLEKLPHPMRSAFFAVSKMSKSPTLDLHREHLRRLAVGEEFFWGGAVAFNEYTKSKILSPEFRAEMTGRSSFEVIAPHYAKLDRAAAESGHDIDFLNRMIYLELKIRLPELLLMRVDKITMANSIESRVPFLDHRLVEKALTIPMDLKLKNGTSKYILKRAVEGIIPNDIIYRKKQGFGAPVQEWLRGPLKDELPAVLLNSKIWRENIFSREAVEQLIADHQSGRIEASFRIWNLITLALWYDRWMA